MMKAPPVPTMPTHTPMANPARTNAITGNLIGISYGESVASTRPADKIFPERSRRGVPAKRLISQLLAVLRPVTMNEITGRHSLLALRLDFKQFNGSTVPAAEKELRAFYE